MSSSENNFSITSKLGIATTLRAIKTQNIMVHMSVGGYEQALITTILDVNIEEPSFIVDSSSDRKFNRHLTRPSNIHFSAVVDKIRVQFSIVGPAQQLTYENRSAYKLPFPEVLQRIQRRDNYRIDIPTTSNLLFQASIENEPNTFKAKDLSAGGIALYDPSQILEATPGTQYKNCSLDLEDLGKVNVDLIIRRVAQEGEPSKSMRVIGCEFTFISNQDLIKVQNYLGRIERMLSARLRGFD